MITPVEIKKAVITLLKGRYGNVPCYGADVKEGLRKPSFFIKLIPSEISNGNYGTFRNTYICAITYFQKKVSEAEMLGAASELHRLFGRKLCVGNRYIDVSEFRYDLVGENGDILQVTVEFSFLDSWERETEPEKAKEVRINEELED